MKKQNKKRVLFTIVIILSLVFLIFLIRLFSPREIDDVSPEIFCEEGYLQKSDIFWVIPKFNNKPISDNQEWCKYILSLNKTLGLHGVTHEYEEFGEKREGRYLQEGIKIFEDCFNQTPTRFKPPQLKISEENKDLIKNNNLSLKWRYNPLIRKVYHCNNTGKFSNKLLDFI